MTDDKLEFKGPASVLPVPMWRCPAHGVTDLVVTIYLRGDAATFCLPCVLAMFDRLGLQPVPRAD